jgi:hypothetical protein
MEEERMPRKIWTQDIEEYMKKYKLEDSGRRYGEEKNEDQL